MSKVHTLINNEEFEANAREACAKAADYIAEHGWCQDDWEDGTGAVCAEGALRHVTGVYEEPTTDYTTLMAARCLVLSHLEDNGHLYPAVPHWNDNPRRTAEDVILTLKKIGAGE